MFWGKLIGFFAGFALLWSHIGALIGFVIGAMYDIWHSYCVTPLQEKEVWHQEFSIEFICLHAMFAKSDGVVSSDEIIAFRKCVQIPPDDSLAVGIIYNSAKNDLSGLDSCILRLKDLCTGDENILCNIVYTLMFVAISCGGLSVYQRKFIAGVAANFEIPAYKIELMEKEIGLLNREQKYNQGDSKSKNSSDGSFTSSAIGDDDPYKVLGIKPTASKQDIKKAYHELIRKNHPDILYARGASKKEILAAEIKMAKINAAYSVINSK